MDDKLDINRELLALLERSKAKVGLIILIDENNVLLMQSNLNPDQMQTAYFVLLRNILKQYDKNTVFENDTRGKKT